MDSRVERERRAFLFIPRTINEETRWLEHAIWHEIKIKTNDEYIWEVTHWIDSPEYVVGFGEGDMWE